MRFDDLVNKLLKENSHLQGVKDQDGILKFYNTFEGDSYEDLKFSRNIPSFNSIPDVETKEPDARVSASGVILLEPDGRIWIRKVSNNYGGYIYSFAKGRIDRGYTIQQNAIKETFEELGFVSKIKSWLTDVQGDTSVTRFYLGERIGGHPYYFGRQDIVETEFIVLADKAHAMKLLNRDRDKQVLSMIH
jgi:8-oxo-dGTP pyrophosphatase MutT (NUDIX family)